MSQEKRRYLTDESARRLTRPVVTVLLLVGLALAFWVWPEGITDKPFGDVSLSELLEAGAAVLVGLFTFAVVARAWLDL